MHQPGAGGTRPRPEYPKLGRRCSRDLSPTELTRVKIGPVLLDIQLDARPDQAAARAAELATTGVAGLFTFEGPHDVFLPLAATASRGVDVDLMTNVAIATPRSPMHLAHAAYDLQLMSGGRFRLGLGSQIQSRFASPCA